MNWIRNNEWQNDEELQSSIKHYVMQNMKRSEVLDFLQRDYPEYAWSLPTLDRRMRYFDIKYINYETTVDEVVAVSNTENDGPGQLLGCRALHKKLREQHGLAVPNVFFSQLNVINPRGLVDNVMTMECLEGLERGKNVGKKKQKTRGPVGTFTLLVIVKKKTFQQKNHLVVFWVPGAHGNCNPVN